MAQPCRQMALSSILRAWLWFSAIRWARCQTLHTELEGTGNGIACTIDDLLPGGDTTKFRSGWTDRMVDSLPYDCSCATFKARCVQEWDARGKSATMNIRTFASKRRLDMSAACHEFHSAFLSSGMYLFAISRKASSRIHAQLLSPSVASKHQPLEMGCAEPSKRMLWSRDVEPTFACASSWHATGI